MTQQQLRKVIIEMAVLFLIVAVVMLLGMAQAPPSAPKAKYEPSELQALRLKVKQQEAVLAQRDLRDAQMRLQAAMTELEAAAQAIKKENKWADNVQFDVNTLTFTAPPEKGNEKKP